MVINRKRFLLATAMCVLFLTACTDNETSKEDDPKPEEQETTVEALTHEKAVELADHIFSEIQDEFDSVLRYINNNLDRDIDFEKLAAEYK